LNFGQMARFGCMTGSAGAAKTPVQLGKYPVSTREFHVT